MTSAPASATKTTGANIDRRTVEGFGEEWDSFDQTELDEAEHRRLFEAYFSVFPWQDLPTAAEGFDLGCGSGRWAALAAERVGTLHCIDASAKALAVAKRRLEDRGNVRFHCASVDRMPLPDHSQDFGYSLGVLHHIPDTEAALEDCVAKLKPGAPFLVYLYYAFDNRPSWFRRIWKTTDLGRRVIARMPFLARKALTSGIAATVYWPMTRIALLGERLGLNVENVPRHCSFYTMRTDALDRFGTRLEQRFTRSQIATMMERAGLKDIVFRDDVPFWVACGRKQTP
jgi:ubiquinone/menaquinone biosynthesis C-methylase UbiE